MKKTTFRQRFSYWFDNQMSKGMRSLVKLLVFFTLGVGIIVALLFFLQLTNEDTFGGGTAGLYSGATMLFEDAGAFVLVALAAFMLGVVVTLLCLRLKKRSERQAPAPISTSTQEDTKMKLRKTFSMILAAVLIISALPASAFADAVIVSVPGSGASPSDLVVSLTDPKPEVEVSSGQQGQEISVSSQLLEPEEPELDLTPPNIIVNIDPIEANQYGYTFNGTEDWYLEAWAGYGTKHEPYVIEDAGDLRRLSAVLEACISDFSGCYFLLTQDIDLGGFCGENNGNWAPIGTQRTPFKGTFDGDGHTISGLYINNNQNNRGLFGVNGGTVKNLTVNGKICGGAEGSGGVAGRNTGLITGCAFYGEIDSSKAVGGIAGRNEGIISDCANHGRIKCSESDGGGIAGVSETTESSGNTGSAIKNCLNYGEISGNNNANDYVGGVAGCVSGGLIEDCANYGSVNNSKYIGGVVGRMLAGANGNRLQNTVGLESEYAGGIASFMEGSTLNNCTNTAAVNGKWSCRSTGGIAAKAHMSTIAGCINTGAINLGKDKDNSGGIAGEIAGVTITNCANIAPVCGGENVGGIVGYAGKTWYQTPSTSLYVKPAKIAVSSAISHCVNLGDVTAELYIVGGIAGYAHDSKIDTCRNGGKVTGGDRVGGIVGYLKRPFFENIDVLKQCMNTGDVLGAKLQSWSTQDYIGGIVGWADGACGTILDCMNTGNVSGHNGVGGIGGDCADTNFARCIVTGTVEGNSKVHMICGDHGTFSQENPGKYEYCYYVAYEDHPTGFGGWLDRDYWGLFVEYPYGHVAPIRSEDLLAGPAHHDIYFVDITMAELGFPRDPIWTDAYIFPTWSYNFDSVWEKVPGIGVRLRNVGLEAGADTIHISSVEDLRNLSAHTACGFDYEGVTVILDNDINLDGVSNWQPIGDNSIAAEASFAGTFEGGGHRITGLTINTDKAYQGLFGKVTGTVKDLTVTGSVTAGGYAGGIVGEVNGTIENCCFIGSVSAGSVTGGIVGLMGGGTVSDCTFSGSVTAANGYAGGLAGQLTGGTVERCTAIAEVTGGKECVGGLAGYLMGGILTNCVHVGNVTGTVNVEGNNPVLTVGVGGIAGRCGDFAVSIINNCHYTGAVSGYSYVGGVIGENRSTGVSQLLVGNYYLSGTVSCYGLAQGDRGIGYDRNGSPYGSENPSGVAPLSLEGFFDAVSFSGWDFDTVWIMTSERPAIQENGVDITFGANGGTGSMDSIFLPPFGGMVPECGFTKEGCAFVCWNTSSDAGGTVYYPGDWMPGDRPQTLYAMWQSTESFGYVDSSGAARTARNCSAVSADLAVMRDGWYFASGEVTMTKRLEIYGDVRLILADGAVLNVPLGIHVPEGSSFTVYGQNEKYYDSGSVSLTQGTGVLNAGNLAVFGGSTYGDGAPIGGDRSETSGEIFLCGGIIRAESHSGAAAIGGGFDGSSGPIELSSGNFTAIGGTVDQENWECASSGIGAGVPLETGGRIVSSVSFAGLSIRSAVVHAEAGTLAGRGTPARAIGNSTGTDFDISKIYPLVHVKVKGEDGDPVAWNRMAWFCTKQSVDVSPCLGHLGCDDDLYRCRYCGSTEDMGIVFVDCRYNLESSRDFSIGLEPGSSLKITSDIYVPENKYFIGWNTSKDGSGVWYMPGDVIAPNASITLYAQWGDRVNAEYVESGVSQHVWAKPLTADTSVLESEWYVAEGTLNLTNGLTVEGDAKLILADGCTVNSMSSIIVPEGKRLTVYGLNTGTLSVSADGQNAAIGGEAGGSAGELWFYGGIINATAADGAGLGAGASGTCRSVNVNGGTITAQGSAGISGSTVILCGGFVTTTGSSRAGIDAVYTMILGGTITAETENAQAQAVSGGLYLRSELRAYDASNAQTPVSKDEREDAVHGSYVRVERCSEHYVYGNECQYCGADYSNTLNLSGSGEEVDPYLLGVPTDWAELARFIRQGGDTTGLYFRQTVGFNVPEPLGTASNPFKGIYDGGSEFTLFYDADGGAPFAYIEDAQIHSVSVTGTITASGQFAASLVSHASGTCVIEDCRSRAVISSSVSGAGYHGGFIGEIADGSNVTLTHCLFFGSILGEGTTSCGGFVGKAGNAAVTLTRCLMAAEAFAPTASQNFVCASADTVLTLESCYTLDVTAAGSAQGAHGYEIAGDSIALSWADGAGFGWNNVLSSAYNDKIYAAEGETVSFKTKLGYTPLYSAQSEITRNGDVFTLTVPAGDVTIKKSRDVQFAIHCESGLVGGSVDTNFVSNTAYPGAEVKADWITEKAYLFKSITVTDSHGNVIPTRPAGDNVVAFTMPADEVFIIAAFQKKYSYTTYDDGSVAMTLERGVFSDDTQDRWVWNDPVKEKVESVVSNTGVRFTGDCMSLFAYFDGCKFIDLRNVDTTGLTSMNSMFLDCENLTDIFLDGWDVSAVTDIGYMFKDCTSLTSLDLSALTLSEGANTEGLFAGADALRELTIPAGMAVNAAMQLNNNGGGWTCDGGNTVYGANGSSVEIPASEKTLTYVWYTDAIGPRYTFSEGTLTLRWGDFSASDKWNENDFNKNDVTCVQAESGVRFVGNCSELFSQFANCKTMYLNEVDTSEMTDMSHMFYFCRNIERINLSGWDTSNVTDMSQAFYYCDKLTLLNIAGWNTAAVTSMAEMFAYCTSLETLDLTGWDTTVASTLAEEPYNPGTMIPLGIMSMFEGADALKCLTISPTMSVISEMQLNPGDPSDAGWIARFDDTSTVVSGNGTFAAIAAPTEAKTYVWKVSVPVFKSHTLLLSGQIGVNFYVDLSKLSETDRRSAVMEFTVNGQTTTDTFDETFTNPSTHEYYGFTCYITSVQMNDTITAVLKYGEGGQISQTYSAADYVESVNSNAGSYSQNTIALVESIADYGHYIQPFLAGSNNWTVGTEHAEMAGSNTLTESDVQAAKAAVADKAVVRSAGESAVDAVTFSLNLETETAIRIYLRLRDGYTGTVTATVDGAAADCTLQPDGRYRIEIGGISAHKLGDTYRVVVSAGGEFTIDVSALSYVNTVLNSTDSRFNNDTSHYAVTALYRYYLAATNYKDHPND